jgi:GAF domain-containing protein
MLPLITHGELIGILNLGAESPSAFVPEHVDIARELADQLAIAIQQARLHEQVQRHAEELEQRVAGRTAELERRTVQLQVAAEVARDATTARDVGELLNRAAGPPI